MSYRPITDVWLLTRCKYKGGIKRYGGYLGGFPERARALLGATIDEPVLHVCGGHARLYPYKGGFGPNDNTLDLDPACTPDYLEDARNKLPSHAYPTVDAQGTPVNGPRFKAMLIDPPYSEQDAASYSPGAAAYPKPNQLVANALASLQPGQRVGIIHYILPKAPNGSRFVAAIGVLCGFNNRIRIYSVFEKETVVKTERRQRSLA